MAVLAGGDVAALLLFAAIGRSSHGFSVFDFETFKTADPFIAGTLSFPRSNLIAFIQSFSVSLLIHAVFAFVLNTICICRIAIYLCFCCVSNGRVVFECLLPWGI